MATTREKQRGVQMRPWEVEAAFGEVERKRRKAMRVDHSVILNIRARLGEAITASAIFMSPLVEKDDERIPMSVDEVLLSVEEMEELKTQPLRLSDAQLRAVILRDDKRTQRKMPMDMKKRVIWARENVNMARATFTIRKSDVRELIGKGAQRGGEGVEGWDAQDFVMGRYRTGMMQARTAWTNLFYSTQSVKPFEVRLDAKASAKFARLIQAGSDDNEYTRVADDQASEERRPVVLVDVSGAVLYSVHPESIAPLVSQMVARQPGKLKRQWHHIQRASATGVSIDSLTDAQSERVGEILAEEGPQPLSYLTARLLIEEYYANQYDVDMRDLSHEQAERAVAVVSREGIIEPHVLASRIGWQQYASRFETNPKSDLAERAEHDAIWSLKF